MPDKLHLAVDPYLLCVPISCHSQERLEGYVTALVGWCDVLKNKDALLLVSDAARSALLETGEYPQQHKLRKLLRVLGSDVADDETVCRLIQTLIESTPSLEEYYGVGDLLINEDNSRVSPCELLDRLSGKVRTAFIETLVMVSIEAKAPELSSLGSAVIASTLDDCGEGSEPIDVEVDAELHMWSWAQVERHALPSLPSSIQFELSLATSYIGLLRQFGVWEVWKRVTDASDMTAALEAIEIRINELRESGVDCEGRIEFQLGARFLESVQTWGFDKRSDYACLLVESCARIVLDVPKNSVDVFHEHTNPRRQIRRGDGGLAFRTHLTKKGAGFRLMLWKLPDGGVEFANVGDKDELIIL